MMHADLLWVAGYYDGPLSGLCTYKGQTCWFAAEGDDAVPGAWGLYWLTETELAGVLADKAAFEALVSTRWSYDLPPSKRVVRPSATHRQYYDGRRPRPLERWVQPGRRVGVVSELRDPRKNG